MKGDFKNAIYQKLVKKSNALAVEELNQERQRWLSKSRRHTGSNNREIDDLFKKISERITMDASTTCWNWVGHMDRHGYGTITWLKRYWRIHRLMLSFKIGPLGKFYACHTCNNRKCVNPEHLYKGTAKTNMRDCIHDGNHKIPDNRGERSSSAKLTRDDVFQIRTLRNEQKLSLIMLGKMFSVTPQNVWSVVHNKTWINEVDK